MHRWLLLLGLLACNGTDSATTGDAGGPGPVDSGSIIDADLAEDTSMEAAPPKRTGCLDRPNDVPRPPTGGLPCELIPPGLSL
jgi:hypothetical protein